MKSLLKILFVLLVLSIITISCNKVRTYQSKAIIINRSIDLTLKDSALIYGMVYSAEDEKTPEIYANIWIEGTNTKTTSDSIGFFSIKLIPASYSIKCLGKYSNKDKTIELNDIVILPNEKIEIKFLQGVVIDF